MPRSGNANPRGVRYALIQQAWDAEREAARRALVDRIQSAFRDVRLGNGRSLHQARAIDNYEPAEVVAAARAFDTEPTWQEIPDEKVDRLADALGFLDAEGFRFYIPRFMLAALRQQDPSDSPAFDAVDAADVPEDCPRLALLSPEQRLALNDFVQFFRVL